MTTKQTKYEVVDKESGLLLQSSHTDLELSDYNQLKSLLCNTFWSNLIVVHKFQTNPDSLLIYRITNGKNNRVYRSLIKHKEKT